MADMSPSLAFGGDPIREPQQFPAAQDASGTVDARFVFTSAETAVAGPRQAAKTKHNRFMNRQVDDNFIG